MTLIKPSLIQEIFTKEGPRIRWSHQGLVTQEEIESGCHFIEENIDITKLRKALLAVFIELSQNVLIHQLPPLPSQGSNTTFSRVEIAQDESHWFVATQNLAKDAQCQHVANQIKTLQMLSQSELKVRYKELRKQDPSNKGAGLGICRILRQSKDTIYLKKTPTFDSISLLTLVSKIQIS